MNPWRWAVVVVLLGSLAGVTAWALGRDGPEDAAAADPPATETRPSPEESAAPSPSPEPSPTEVLPANDVQDPLEAIVAIEAYRDWLFENPDPDKVDLIYHEACECYYGLSERLAAMSAEGVALQLDATRVTDLQLVERDSPRTVIATYRTWPGAGRELDESGKVTATRDAATEGLLWRVNLLWGDDGRWRVIATRGIDE